MARTCEYCGLSLDPSDGFCPNCGAPAPALDETDFEPETVSVGVPRTIRELKSFCRSKNMPLEQMRFFIGLNYRGPRAFGIYQDDEGDFVVYKNKADGTRAIRYQGPDEAQAVREIYLKLKDETAYRRGNGSYAADTRSLGTSRRRGISFTDLILVILVIGIAVSMAFRSIKKSPENGYYLFEDNYYYYQSGDWYYYSRSMLDWVAAGIIDQELEDNYRDYYESQNYRYDFGIGEFEDSAYYEAGSESRTDNDDDDETIWEYDFDSWDAGDTDWNSDW